MSPRRQSRSTRVRSPAPGAPTNHIGRRCPRRLDMSLFLVNQT